MTCIIGFVDKNKDVYIGGDSAGVAGLEIHERKDTKVFKIQNFLIGYTSSFRMGQLLRFKLKVKKQSKIQSDYEYMCTTFIDSVRKCLKDNGYAEVHNNKEEIGSFLVGYNGHLYSVADDLQVGEDIDNYDSCGCGHPFAFGALNILTKNKNLSAEDIITGALETATKFSGGVRPPFIIKKI